MHNIIFKIKYKLYTVSGVIPPPSHQLKILGTHLGELVNLHLAHPCHQGYM